MTITTEMVRELRERTGVGIMDCKKALNKAAGDMEAAIVALRKKGMASAERKAARAADEGIISVAISEDAAQAAILEVNCETDFVAKSDVFTQFADQLSLRIIEEGIHNLSNLSTVAYSDNGETVESARQALVSKVGENIAISRLFYLSPESRDYHYAYRHGGRIGVLVALNQDNPALGKDVAMHIAATNPSYISEADVPTAVLNKEKDIYLAQAKDSGKPASIMEKIVNGRLQKFVAEITLCGQPFVKDPDISVGELLAQSNARVLAVKRYEVGEKSGQEATG